MKEKKEASETAKAENPKKEESKEAEKSAEEKSDDNKPENLIVNPFDLIDSNLEMLQKSGEELFNQLAQPKTAGEEESGETALEGMSSDLDKLLDVLEDRVVITDAETPEMKSETQEITEKVKEKLDTEN